MRKSSLLTIIMACFIALMCGTSANAQASRTWVSGVGDDANPCSRTAPCKTFAGAISKTVAGGYINCLDPGGFGAVTITKSITIDCEDTFAGVLASLTTGIILNGAGIVVTLRNLSIEGLLNGINGINVVQGSALRVENCRISGFVAATSTGIRFAPATVSELYVENTTISESGTGILLAPTGAGGARVAINGSRIVNNAAGLLADGNVGGIGGIR